MDLKDSLIKPIAANCLRHNIANIELLEVFNLSVYLSHQPRQASQKEYNRRVQKEPKKKRKLI